jgi:hypothetical protein
MPLRTFMDRDGADWRVWSVTPEPHAALTLDEEFRAGWLCFERMDGAERRRLALTEVPAAWEALTDERLDLLRRVAVLSAPSLLEQADEAASHGPVEDEARARRSGPKSAVGGEDGVST